MPSIESEGISDASVGKSSYLYPARCAGANQCPARGIESQTVPGETGAKNLVPIQIVMKNDGYEMIIWWSEEDDAFVVDVPELAGCMAHGKTRIQAIKNAEEAIAFWIKTAKEDGEPIPAPKGRLLYA